MKVLMLGWELPPHNSGGLGVACYHLCKALSHKGVDIEFILPYTADHKIDFMRVTAAQPLGVKTVRKAGTAYDSYCYEKKDGSVEQVTMYEVQDRYVRSVETLLPYAQFDIIHAHDWLTARAAIRAKQITGKPLILHIHSVESDRAGANGGGNQLVREIEELSLNMADRIIAVSQWTKNAIIREYGIPADKIDVVHNSIDIDSVDTLDSDNAYVYLEKMRQQGYRVVVNIGRLTIMKGLPNLIRAMRSVVDRLPKSLLLVVGAGEQYHELLELTADLGLSQNVIFADFQRGKRWRDAYAVADLFVLPSVSEPFGLTPLEAIGYGTPALVSKQSGISEVLNNALKVDFWDVDEMANQITAVLRSDDLRDELHRNSYSEYLRMSWQPSADKIIGTYRHHHLGAAL